MNLFTINILLAAVWAAFMSSFNFPTLLAGYAIGFGALWAAQPLYNQPSGYFRRVWRIVKLTVYFTYELVMSSVQVVRAVLAPGDVSTPKIVEMPLDAKSDAEILLVSSLISLTPGTLSLDVSEDRGILYVHSMFAQDPDAIVADLKSGMERLVVEVFEP
ncbi:MAG: Na+/H+ antiporter subunit E [Pseudomonadota bacterium]